MTTMLTAPPLLFAPDQGMTKDKTACWDPHMFYKHIMHVLPRNNELEKVRVVSKISIDNISTQ